jgi:hypothetical protein
MSWSEKQALQRQYVVVSGAVFRVWFATTLFFPTGMQCFTASDHKLFAAS